MRLDKYLCEAEYGTRSEVKKLLRSCIGTVNGERDTKPETKIKDGDVVCVAGKEASFSRVE